MALVLLRYPDTPRTKIDTILLDALINESPVYADTVTTNPVEDGTTISDHIISQPLQLTLNCIASDYPIPNSIQANVSNETGRRSLDVYFKLLDLRNKRTLIDVQTGLDFYPDMAISSFNPKRDNTTTNTLSFQIELTQITKTSSAIIKVPRTKIKETPVEAKDQSQGTVNKGSQSTKPADTKSNSIALGLWNTLFK